MGNHSMPSKQIVKRTVAAGTIAGCSAVGLGALSTVAAPAANACWLGCHSTHNSTTSTPAAVAGSMYRSARTTATPRRVPARCQATNSACRLALASPQSTPPPTPPSATSAPPTAPPTPSPLLLSNTNNIKQHTCTGGAGAGVGAAGTGGSATAPRQSSRRRVCAGPPAVWRAVQRGCVPCREAQGPRINPDRVLRPGCRPPTLCVGRSASRTDHRGW